MINDQIIIFGGTGPRKKEITDNFFRYLAEISVFRDLQAQIHNSNFNPAEFQRSLHIFQQRINSLIQNGQEHNPLINYLSNMIEEELSNLLNMIDNVPVPSEESQPVVQTVEALDQENLELAEDNELEFVDSDSDDLINEESDDDDDDNDLESWSDLHILDLNVPSLKNLTKIFIIKNKIPNDCLPKVLM